MKLQKAIEALQRGCAATRFYASIGLTADGVFSPPNWLAAERMVLAYAEIIGAREHLCSVDRAEKWRGGSHDATCDQWLNLCVPPTDDAPWCRALLVDSSKIGEEGEAWLMPQSCAPSDSVEAARYIIEQIGADPATFCVAFFAPDGIIDDDAVIEDCEAPS